MAEFLQGQKIGERFEIVKLLGRGGMGTVFLAKDLTKGTMVALKQIEPSHLGTPGVRERFRNEVAANFKVDHPNTVKAVAHLQGDGAEILVLEYVDGGDLSLLMAEGAVPVKRCIAILHHIASGLEAIHKCGIVHRDLKPENILMTKGGVAKISDFGVVGLGGETTLTQAGSLVGTVKYIPPEFIETGECDSRGDLFAFGVIAFELVTGTSPFRTNSINSLVMERFKKDIREELQIIAPDCPPKLMDIITKAMTVRVAQRYQSASEILSDLRVLEAEVSPIAKALPKEKAVEVHKVHPSVVPSPPPTMKPATSVMSYLFLVTLVIAVVVALYGELVKL